MLLSSDYYHTTRLGTRCIYRLTVPVIIILAIGSGCNKGVYRVSNLPAECLAPSPVNAETINLAGLADITSEQRNTSTAWRRSRCKHGKLLNYEIMASSTTPVCVANHGTIVVPLVGKKKWAL